MDEFIWYNFLQFYDYMVGAWEKREKGADFGGIVISSVSVCAFHGKFDHCLYCAPSYDLFETLFFFDRIVCICDILYLKK